MVSRDEPVGDTLTLAERLEQGELLHFETCPFRLPADDDLAFLRSQPTSALPRQELGYDPRAGLIHGPRSSSGTNGGRLARLLNEFSKGATAWLADLLPQYAGQWIRDRATLRTEEEATRLLRPNWRTDLLHIDNFPDRPSMGRRILRLLVNLDPAEPRVWQTSERFAELLDRYQQKNRVPALTAAEWQAPLNGLQRLMQRDWSGRPAYDSFMAKVQQFLRTDDAFQDKAAKRIWHFPPRSTWLLFGDGLSHAVLRGQYALEHSYFVPVSALVRPDLSPLHQLAALGEASQWRSAA